VSARLGATVVVAELTYQVAELIDAVVLDAGV
jgi:hypothetical protein